MIEEYWTVGSMLRAIVAIEGLQHTTVFNVQYAVSKLRLQPIGRAGNALIYSEAQFGQIKDELSRTSARRIQRAVIEDLNQSGTHPHRVY